jgi:Uma2 family endonuclease
MTVVLPQEKTHAVPPPTRRRWTAAEYHRAAEAGVFGPDERLELIRGEIYRMSPQNGPHAVVTVLAREALQKAFGTGWVVFEQVPLRLSTDSEPEPDLYIAPGNPRDYLDSLPSRADLVVEVAYSSLRFDRGDKLSLYAGASIPEYWILNVAERVLEVHRDPDPEAETFRSVQRLTAGETIAPLAAGGGDRCCRRSASVGALSRLP